MTRVNTVLGTISAQELGKTLVHNHIVFALPGWYADATCGRVDREAAVASGVKLLEEAKGFGVKTFIDATANDMGRSPELLREVAEKTGVNVICSTGFYTESMGATAYFRIRSLFTDVVSEMSEALVTEITRGIADTGIKAGVIKVATGRGAITDYERRCLTAAARAQRETGVPIITHTEGGTMGPEQADLLIAEGANPKSVMIGHMDESTDIRYHVRTLEKGVFIAFDRIGFFGHGVPTDQERYTVISGLINAGYVDRITMANDHSGYMLGRSFVALQGNRVNHPRHLFNTDIPTLKERGVTDAQIETILVDNPRRMFTGA